MRVVVTGATGNVGTSVVKALAAERTVTDVLGVARRRPGLRIPEVRWADVDIDPGRADLAEVFAGADAVVHLARRFQPTHDPVVTWRTNVPGSIGVLEASERAGCAPWYTPRPSPRTHRAPPTDAPPTSPGPPTAGRAPPTRGRRPKRSAVSTASSSRIPACGWSG